MKPQDIINTLLASTMSEVKAKERCYSDDLLRVGIFRACNDTHLGAGIETLKLMFGEYIKYEQYFVRNKAYVFVYSEQGRLINGFRKDQLLYLGRYVLNNDFLEDYTESSRYSTYSKIRSILGTTRMSYGVKADRVLNSYQSDIIRRMREMNEQGYGKSVDKDEPYDDVETFGKDYPDETVPENVRSRYTVEIGPDDLSTVCETLNNLGIQFTLYNKVK